MHVEAMRLEHTFWNGLTLYHIVTEVTLYYDTCDGPNIAAMFINGAQHSTTLKCDSIRFVS